MQPEVKQAGKQQIQEKAKESILAFLNKSKQDSAQREANRKKQQQRNRIWSGKVSDFAYKSDAFPIEEVRNIEQRNSEFSACNPAGRK